MGFPLGEWIDAHPDVPHHLSHSGMIRSLRGLPRVLRDRPRADPEGLRRAIGRLNGVAPDRVYLTHGASEGNMLALLFLARHGPRRRGAGPRIFVPNPEYPPIPDTARWLGFRRAATPQGADVVACSSPANPEGIRRRPEDVRAWHDGIRPFLVDQTFREFTDAPSWNRLALPNLWTTGSFTKIYGADHLRVGYVIPPRSEATEFGELHGLALDQLPPASVAGALAVLSHRSELLAEARDLFRRNERHLADAIDGVPDLSAPLWFDRGRNGLDGDALARDALRSGVLVCSGSFFGDPTGVRLCLTRRRFPEDLRAYLRIRARHVDSPPEFGRRRRKRTGGA